MQHAGVSAINPLQEIREKKLLQLLFVSVRTRHAWFSGQEWKIQQKRLKDNRNLINMRRDMEEEEERKCRVKA